MRAAIIFYFILFISFYLNAQDNFLKEEIFDPSIESVLFYKSGKINSFPILSIQNPDEKLTLAFDDLDGGYTSYAYRIVHCDMDWKQSRLFENDFFEGQNFDYITNYEFSSNTYVNYTNYWLSFPSDFSWFRLPGNYVIQIYDENDEEEILLQRHFYVVDQRTSIQAQVKEASYAKDKNYKQEIDFEVNYSDEDVLNPMQDVKVVIRQNSRWDNQITDLEPMYIQNNTLIYDYEKENLFFGYSEWRYCDYRQLKYPGFGIAKIDLDTAFHMIMLPEEDRSYMAYAEWSDINGQRIIAGEQKDLKMSEIDYVIAHFRLNTPYPKDEEVYVFGALSDWQIKEKFKMHYSLDKKAYVANILLKQGYYNYYYVVEENNGSDIDCARFQGTHFETENEYHILVYVKSRTYDTYELLGYQSVSTATR
jgi:hypothetical protein